MRKLMFLYAPDGAVGDNSDDAGDDREPVGVPTRSFLDLADPYNDDLEEYVIDDGTTPQISPEEEVPEEFKGRTKAQIAADFMNLRAKQNEQVASAAPAFTPDAYAKSMEQVLARVAPPQPVQQQGQNEDPEVFRKKMNDLWLEDPNKAFDQLAARQFNPVLGMMADNQTAMSKEILMLDPSTRAIYAKYGEEIETEVRNMPAADRLRNPKSYQQATERVKARHMDTIMGEQLKEQVQAGVAEALKSMGFDIGPDGKAVQKAQQKQQFQMNSQRAAGSQVSATPRPQVKIPAHVVEEANRRGMDPKVYFRVLREAGRA